VKSRIYLLTALILVSLSMGVVFYISTPRGEVASSAVQLAVAVAVVGAMSVIAASVSKKKMQGVAEVEATDTGRSNGFSPVPAAAFAALLFALAAFVAIRAPISTAFRPILKEPAGSPSEASHAVYMIDRAGDLHKYVIEAPTPAAIADVAAESPDEARRAVLAAANAAAGLNSAQLTRAAALAYAVGDATAGLGLIRRIPPGGRTAITATVEGLLHLSLGSYGEADEALEEAQASDLESNPRLAFAISTDRIVTYLSAGRARGALRILRDLDRGTQMWRTAAFLSPSEKAYAGLVCGDLYLRLGRTKAFRINSDGLWDLAKGLSGVVRGRVDRQRAYAGFLSGSKKALWSSWLDSALSDHAGSPVDRAEDLVVQGEIQRKLRKWDEAELSFQQAGQILDQALYRKAAAESILRQAEVLLDSEHQVDYRRARVLALRAKECFDQFGYAPGTISADVQLGALQLREHRSFGLSLPYYNAAIQLAKKTSNPAGEADARESMCFELVYADSPTLLDRGKDYCKGARVMYKNLGDARKRAQAESNLAKFWEAKKDYQEAITWADRAVGQCQRADYRLGEGRGLLELGNLYLLAREVDTGRQKLLASYNILSALGVTGEAGIAKLLLDPNKQPGPLPPALRIR
jgi:tetratricopeptide (TPR) repeat protein